MSPYFILVPILVPILAGVLLMTFPIQDYKTRAAAVESVVILNTILVFVLLLNRPAERLYLFSFVEGLPLTLNIDGMATFFGGLVACLWPLATLYTFEYMRHEERVNTFLSFYTITYGVTLGVAFSGNIVTMYLFYEALTMVTLPLVIHTMTEEAQAATRKYLNYMIGGTAFAFIGIVFYSLFCTDIEFVLGGSLDVANLGDYANIALLAYVLAFFGFGVKAAVFPFHGWLPTASVAPTPVTALLHAVAVVKSGVFAIMRLTYFCYGADFLKGTWAQTIVVIAAMVTIVYGSTMGVRENHFKRRLAYSTVANLSYILLGVTMMSPLGLTAYVRPRHHEDQRLLLRRRGDAPDGEKLRLRAGRPGLGHARHLHGAAHLRPVADGHPPLRWVRQQVEHRPGPAGGRRSRGLCGGVRAALFRADDGHLYAVPQRAGLVLRRHRRPAGQRPVPRPQLADAAAPGDLLGGHGGPGPERPAADGLRPEHRHRDILKGGCVL